MSNEQISTKTIANDYQVPLLIINLSSIKISEFRLS